MATEEGEAGLVICHGVRVSDSESVMGHTVDDVLLEDCLVVAAVGLKEESPDSALGLAAVLVPPVLDRALDPTPLLTAVPHDKDG